MCSRNNNEPSLRCVALVDFGFALAGERHFGHNLCFEFRARDAALDEQLRFDDADAPIDCLFGLIDTVLPWLVATKQRAVVYSVVSTVNSAPHVVCCVAKAAVAFVAPRVDVLLQHIASMLSVCAAASIGRVEECQPSRPSLAQLEPHVPPGSGAQSAHFLDRDRSTAIFARLPARSTRLVVGGLEVMCLERSDVACAGDAPLTIVFFLHGRTCTMADVAQAASDFVQQTRAPRRRLLAVTLDQRNHGGRTVDARMNGGAERAQHAEEMYLIQLGTARDVSCLIDQLPVLLGRSQAECRFGVCGVSLGGHAAVIAQANERRLAFACSLIGCVDYEALMTQRLGAPLSAPLSELVRATGAASNAAALGQRALLLLNASGDTLVPAQLNAAFAQRGANVHFEVFKHARHEVTPAMWARALAFLGEHACVAAADRQ